jgi:prepilin signal peptidase PulO-like enzyme (type II secretory pathway)
MNSLIFFIFGTIIGSFLNVVIFRLNIRKSFLGGRSFCPKCKKEIAWFDNVPILSFILLAGACRQCKKKISWQYPAVELAAGVIFMLIYRQFGLSYETLAYLVFSGFLIVIFVYDLKYLLILDKVSVPAIITALILNIMLGRVLGDLLLGALIGAGFFAAQYFFSRGKWVGDGDIRLGALMGLMLGWKLLLVALFLAYIIGAAYGLAAIALNKKKMGSQVPFGPFLTLATLIALLYGPGILNWYLNLIF